MIHAWNLKQPFINGCFNWMIPNLYIGNGCFTKRLFINGCLGFQVRQDTLPKTNSWFTPENGWLEDDISFWDGLHSGAVLVFGEGMFQKRSESRSTVMNLLIGAVILQNSQSLTSFDLTPL